MRRPGEVLSRYALLEQVWDYDYENRSNVVDSYVRFLRRKIDKPFGTDSIETVRGVRLPTARGDHGLRRIPIRLRVTLVFAARDGGRPGRGRPLPLPAARGAARRVARHEPALAGDRGRGARAPVGRPTRRATGSNPLVEQDESFAQILGAGRPSRSTRRPSSAARPCSTRTRSCPPPPARCSSIAARCPGVEGAVRMLAAPVDIGGRTVVAVVGSSLGDRDEALSNLARLLLIGGPIALLLASAGRLLAGGRGAAPGRRRCAAGRREISASEPGARLPVPGGRRRAAPARRDPERDARAARGGARARAPFRRRRQPRAADAAGAAQDRARARAAARPGRGRAARRDRLGDRRDRPADRRSPSSCWSSLAIEDGELRIDREPFVIEDALAAIRARFAARAARAGRTLSYEVPPEAPLLAADRTARRAGTHQPRRQRAPPRAGRDQAAGAAKRHRGRAPRHRRGARDPGGLHRPRLRALQPRRTARGPRAAPGSGSRSSTRSPAPTTAQLTRATSRTAAPTSGSRSRTC